MVKFRLYFFIKHTKEDNTIMGNAVEAIHEQHGEPRGSAPVVYLLLSLFGLSIVSFALLQNELNRYLPNA